MGKYSIKVKRKDEKNIVIQKVINIKLDILGKNIKFSNKKNFNNNDNCK